MDQHLVTKNQGVFEFEIIELIEKLIQVRTTMRKFMGVNSEQTSVSNYRKLENSSFRAYRRPYTFQEHMMILWYFILRLNINSLGPGYLCEKAFRLRYFLVTILTVKNAKPTSMSFFSRIFFTKNLIQICIVRWFRLCSVTVFYSSGMYSIPNFPLLVQRIILWM